MSIANIWLEHDSALVCVDGECLMPDGSAAQVSKLLPLVHANTVICGTGHLAFLNQAFACAHGVAGGFDDLVDAFQRVLSVAYEGTLLMLKAQSLDIDCSRQCVMLCGWSDKEGCMRAQIHVRTDESGFRSKDLPHETAYLMPTYPGQTDLPAPRSIELMLQHSFKQVDYMRQSLPGVHAGPPFVVAHLLDRKGMTLFRHRRSS